MNRQLTYNPRKQARGAMLIFTLAILLLLSLMGAAILLNIRSGKPGFNDTLEREAFTRAGAAANIAAIVTRAILNPDMAPPQNFFVQLAPYRLTFREDFNLATLLKEAEDEPNSRRRCRNFLARPEEIEETRPHIFLWQGPELIATAYVFIQWARPVPTGMSLAETDYDFSGGAGASLIATVAVNGQSVNEPGTGAETTYSLITVIFREVI